MNIQNVETPDQENSSTQMQKPQSDSNPFPWSRFVILVLANILYTVINKPDIGSLLLFNIVTIGSIGLFEPVLAHIDNVDSWLTNIPRMLAPFLPFSPGAKNLASRRVRTAQKHARRTLFYYLAILIALCFLLQNIVLDRLNALRDNACIRVAFLSGLCPSGIGIITRTAPDGNPVTVGLVTSTNREAAPFDKSGAGGSAQEQDVENKILLQQDVQGHACSGPHITLAVTTMVSRTITDINLSAGVGLEDLRGAYLAQANYNSQASHRTKLCLVIANIGTRATAADTLPQIVKQLILFSQFDATFRGILGFPFSAHVQDALSTFRFWNRTHIPIISPSATSNDFSSTPDFDFYRVVSSDSYQSGKMAQFIRAHFIPNADTQQSLPTIGIFYDVGRGTQQRPDSYSNSLATAFNDALLPYLSANHIVFQPYSIGDSTSVIQSVQDAILKKHVTMIFFAGYADDIDAVETGIQSAQHASKSDTAIPVFGGDGLYDLTRYINSTFSIVYSTIYAPPLKSDIDIVKDYRQAFSQSVLTPTSTTINDYTLLPPHAILSYDAAQAFLAALDNSLDKNSQETFNQELATVKFSGLSGNIVFQGNSSTNHESDPSDKAVYILCADRNHAIHVAGAYGDANFTYPPLQNVQECSGSDPATGGK